MAKLYAPEVEYYTDRHGSGFSGITLDMNSWKKLDNVFAIMHRLKPMGENDRRSLWIRVPRGPIEAWGNWEEEKEYGSFKDFEEFESEWKIYFPYEENWYKVETLEDTRMPDDGKRFRSLFINNTLVFQTLRDFDERHWPQDASDFIDNLCEALDDTIAVVKEGKYKEKVLDAVPPRYRYGTIARKDCWELYPEMRENEREGITDEQVEALEGLIAEQKKHVKTVHWGNDRQYSYEAVIPDNCLSRMTVNTFLTCCKIGYQACGYEIPDGTSLKDLYFRYADGRDEGMTDIDADSPEAFEKWYHDKKRFGGHPWEICRGGNSTHVSLYVTNTEDGQYYLSLGGKAWSRAAETSKIFIALSEAGYPVVLSDADEILARFKGEGLIGVVPDYVTPRYCEHAFEEEGCVDFMNIPEEDSDEFIKRVSWRDADGGMPEML